MKFQSSVATAIAAVGLFSLRSVEANHRGLIQHVNDSKCWISNTNKGPGSYIWEADCNFADRGQHFRLDTSSQHLIHELTGYCVSGYNSYGHLFLWDCSDDHEAHWKYTESTKTLLNVDYGWYVDLKSNGNYYLREDDRLSILFLPYPTPSPTKYPTPSPTKYPTPLPTMPPVTEAPSDAPSSAPVTEAPSNAPHTAPPTAPLLGSGSGDPHIKTWTGGKYDFHGGCDLVFLKNAMFANGLGLHIHIRTKIESWWSFIDSAVIQIGTHRVELKGGSNEEGGPQYWVNGLSGGNDAESDKNLMVLEEELAVFLPGFKVHYKKVSSKQHKFRIDLNHQGDAISIETYKDWVAVNVKANNSRNFGGALGLMGEYPSGLKVGRDGFTEIKVPIEFGKEWQVHSSEPMLFHNVEGPQHPDQCIMPVDKEEIANIKKRRLGESMVTRDAAVIACAHAMEEDQDACVFDVLASNDMDMAGAY